MIYRIDLKHYLTHAVDYFTRNELAHFQYLIISAKIANGSRCQNVVKANYLYPTTDMIQVYEECKDDNILDELYLEYFDLDKNAKKREDASDVGANQLYRNIINPFINHYDVMILCAEEENPYISSICRIVKKKFGIEVIDLNELFTKGRIGPIYIDRSKVWDKAVDIRRAAGKEEIKAMESTKDGRMRLLNLFSRKEKLAKLKEIGIKSRADLSSKELTELLIDGWVNEESDKE